MIKSNVGLQVACLDYGNWDMHTGLGKPGDYQRLDAPATSPTWLPVWSPSHRPRRGVNKVNVVTPANSAGAPRRTVAAGSTTGSARQCLRSAAGSAAAG